MQGVEAFHGEPGLLGPEALPTDVRRRVSALARTPRLLVACDYDGALAPLDTDHRPDRRPLPEAVRALRELAELPGTVCAVISARPLRDLAALSRLPGEVRLVGAHGTEFDTDLAADPSAHGKAEALEVLRDRTDATAVLYMGGGDGEEPVFLHLSGADAGIRVGDADAPSVAAHRVADTPAAAQLLALLAAERRSWVFGERPTPIERMSLLSDRASVALVGPDARLLWLCHPEPDSPALFAELLGGRSAGVFAIAPAHRGLPLGQRYEPGTMTVRTRFSRLEVIDYLAAGAVLREAGPAAAALVAAAAVAVLAAVAAADRLSVPARRALHALAMTAVAIGAGRLNARVRVRGPRDLVVLGNSINTIGEHVQELLAKEREMVADVSHRLRTPLTALRLDAELLPGAEGERIREAVSALERDVDEIIRNARPRPDVLTAELESDLVAVVRERMGFWSVFGEDQGREVEVDLPDTPARVALPPQECAAVLDALVGNVFRHTPAGSPLAVTVVRHAGWVTLIVEDAGPGFADPAAALRRGASGGGSTGLGLDIVRNAVEAIRGTVHLERGRLGGARVRARFAEAGVPHAAEPPRAWRLRRSG
ncbi:trehalase-like domain-containing protein [Nocardiopsis sp. CC223A]|uniref:trehalase-like domain-containing protein n=1 Tax=Nocardiopsis sp. CC223A TaxID=3044051 RepID=UPI00278BFCC0|nr:trehalase-like domain-containing protein [Nocardiopsis sp. CC223A]